MQGLDGHQEISFYANYGKSLQDFEQRKHILCFLFLIFYYGNIQMEFRQ